MALCLSALALAAGSAHAADAPAAEPPPAYTLTGHIDLVSRYYLRGLTKTYGNGPALGNEFADAPESDKPALQWGADFAHSSGFYLGYWGSQINYSYKRLGESYSDRSITDFQDDKSIENDFYGGYTGSFGDVGYTVGATYYYYINGKNSNAWESKLGLSYGPVAFNVQTLLKDTTWGNDGDTYWSLVYSRPLPYSITFTGTLGFYTYKKEGKFLGTRDTFLGVDCAPGTAFNVSGCFAGSEPIGSAFRTLILGVAQPIAELPVTWNAQWIIPGKNRFDVTQSNKLVVGIVYGF
jgi:uncharacterized protein (TIGR02001 family)